VKYIRLDSGYHYVKAIDYAHLFAQWPVGTPLRAEHVGYNDEIDVPTLIEFMQCADFRETNDLAKQGDVK
jgi:hypothetical protein